MTPSVPITASALCKISSMKSSFCNELSLFCLRINLLYYYFDDKSSSWPKVILNPVALTHDHAWASSIAEITRLHGSLWFFSLQNSKPYKALVTITLTELTKCVLDDNIYFCTFRTLPVFVGLLWKGLLLCVVGGLHSPERMCLFVHLLCKDICSQSTGLIFHLSLLTLLLNTVFYQGYVEFSNTDICLLADCLVSEGLPDWRNRKTMKHRQ